MKKLAKEDDSGEDDEEDEEEKEEKEEKDEKKKDNEDDSPWAKFYKEFNKNLKMGCYEDPDFAARLLRLTVQHIANTQR
eukprot:3672441-Amphidinium_carterae.1